MDDQIIVRIKKEVKKEFADLAKQNGTDSSSLIRNYIEKYIEENRLTSKEDLDSMWNLGQNLQKVIGIEKSFELLKGLQILSDTELVSSIMKLLAEYEVCSPKILIELDKNPQLKIALFAGFIGEIKEEV